MSMVASTESRPRDGDAITHCGHVVGRMHWFQYARPLRFRRPDGTRGEASWLAACEQCFIRHGAEVVNFVRGDGTWTGDAPAIERTEA